MTVSLFNKLIVLFFDCHAIFIDMVPVTLKLFVLFLIDWVKLFLSLAKVLVDFVALRSVFFAEGFCFRVIALVISFTGLAQLIQLFIKVLKDSAKLAQVFLQALILLLFLLSLGIRLRLIRCGRVLCGRFLCLCLCCLWSLLLWGSFFLLLGPGSC